MTSSTAPNQRVVQIETLMQIWKDGDQARDTLVVNRRERVLLAEVNKRLDNWLKSSTAASERELLQWIEASVRTEAKRLLVRIREGHNARNELFELAYAEVREMCRRFRKQEEMGTPTLNTTALANEVWVRLLEGKSLAVADRRYFFASMGYAIERTYIHYARLRSAQKRGGHMHRQPFEVVMDKLVSDVERRLGGQLLDLHESLSELSVKSPDLHYVIVQHYVSGRQVDEIAKELRVTPSTIHKRLRAGLNWLHGAMKQAT
jgi:RNA polymerase sigma factor (TIGR02999 family)